jgi:hypothetical protein
MSVRVERSKQSRENVREREKDEQGERKGEVHHLERHESHDCEQRLLVGNYVVRSSRQLSLTEESGHDRRICLLNEVHWEELVHRSLEEGSQTLLSSRG